MRTILIFLVIAVGILLCYQAVHTESEPREPEQKWLMYHIPTVECVKIENDTARLVILEIETKKDIGGDFYKVGDTILVKYEVDWYCYECDYGVGSIFKLRNDKKRMPKRIDTDSPIMLPNFYLVFKIISY